MINEDLDKRLMEIIKEQQSPKLRMIDPQDPRCRRLLDILMERTSSSIDVFYVLTGAVDAKYWFIDEALNNPTEIYFNPHLLNYFGEQLYPCRGHTLEEAVSVNRGIMNSNNFALMVDDSWNSGNTTRKTITYLKRLGYKPERIFVFHYFGSGAFEGFEQFRSKRFGFVNHNPVLLSSATMLDFFDHPEKYQ